MFRAAKVAEACCEIIGEISGISKPMVCQTYGLGAVAFHENEGNHENDENDENDEDNSDSYKQGVECWIRGNHGNHENDENHENPGCKPRVPQTTGLEIPENLMWNLIRNLKPPMGKIGEIWGEDFLPARTAREVSGRISGQISEKVSETLFQISRFFGNFAQQKGGASVCGNFRPHGIAKWLWKVGATSWNFYRWRSNSQREHVELWDGA